MQRIGIQALETELWINDENSSSPWYLQNKNLYLAISWYNTNLSDPYKSRGYSTFIIKLKTLNSEKLAANKYGINPCSNEANLNLGHVPCLHLWINFSIEIEVPVLCLSTRITWQQSINSSKMRPTPMRWLRPNKRRGTFYTGLIIFQKRFIILQKNDKLGVWMLELKVLSAQSKCCKRKGYKRQIDEQGYS